MTLTLHTDCADDTRDLATALAQTARPGDVFVLAGDLGAGKTAFTQGLAAAVGVSEAVTSPTFTLANAYVADGALGIIDFHHLDVYRLEQLEEVTDAGLFDLFDGKCVVAIEWGDVLEPLLPTDYLEIRFAFGRGDDDRTLTIRPVGLSWRARERTLAEGLGRWQEAGVR